VCLVTASKSSVLPWKLSLYKIFDEICFLIAAENDICFKAPGVKWPGHDVDNSPPSSTEVKNHWSFTSSSTVCFVGMDRDNLTPPPPFFEMQMCDGIVYEAQRNCKEILEISVWSRSNEQTCSFQMVEVF